MNVLLVFEVPPRSFGGVIERVMNCFRFDVSQ